MSDHATKTSEATITIAGATLTQAEAMTLRVAIGDFRMMLVTARQLLGPQLTDNYDQHARAIERLLLTGTRE